MHAQSKLRGRGALVALAVVCISAGPPAGPLPGAPAATAAPTATISVAGAGKRKKVRYGRRVTIAGYVSPHAGGRPVELERSGRSTGFHRVDRTTTEADGSYRFAFKARRSSTYRAVAQDAPKASPVRRVVVVAKLAGRATRHVRSGRSVRVRGRLLPRLRGRRLRLQMRAHGRWKTVDRTRTRRRGRFRASFRPRRPGVYRLRVRFGGDRAAAATRDRLRRAFVYRQGHASWYGPGLYGNPTACGGTLGANTLGVAHKYLPCGTRVTFRYRGRSVTVPVIDRGPFVAGREWDLTAATKRRLGFGQLGAVWSTR